MSIRTAGRCGVALFLAVIVSGCGLLGSGHSGDGEVEDARVATTSLECRLHRAGCIYEGSYESGERGYAEEEARRLNQASIERLRRLGR